MKVPSVIHEFAYARMVHSWISDEIFEYFFNVLKHYGRMIVPAFSIISTISYMLVTLPTARLSFRP